MIFIILILSLTSILIDGEISLCKAKLNSAISSYKNKSKENSGENDNIYYENRRYKILVATLRRNLIEKYNELDEIWVEKDHLQLTEPHVDKE